KKNFIIEDYLLISMQEIIISIKEKNFWKVLH
ncbi:unnamed protein product, partial [marine sediment metagenome]